MKTIIIIPARGGSKGIPRKNLRPLCGKPLIYYSITSSLAADYVSRVVVSTDDEEIALFSERFGADVILRPESLADDEVTLDPVIVHAVSEAEERWGQKYDLVVTIQPTSPLITSAEIESAIEVFQHSEVDTALSVVEDRHLRWCIKNGSAKPLYRERVNRQKLPATYRETGAVIACTREQLSTGTRIGKNVRILDVPHDRSVDIDTYADLALCESLLKRKKVVLTVIGNEKTGMGHVYRALMIAHELVQYDIHFLCEEGNDLAISYVREKNYTVHVCKGGQLSSACIELSPRMVINDILDTDGQYISDLKNEGIIVVNFEDLGSGSKDADLVINALYPHQDISDRLLAGPKYFCLRDEFVYLPSRNTDKKVRRILLTFGGVDEGCLTLRCLKLLGEYCAENDIAIDIVVGPGFAHSSSLTECIRGLPGLDVTVANSTSRISDYMVRAGLAITSGGRTVLELAAVAVPTIVICQNEREETHTFASKKNGVINLGNRRNVLDSDIFSAVVNLIENEKKRKNMRNKLMEHDLKRGKERVIGRIISLMERGA